MLLTRYPAYVEIGSYRDPLDDMRVFVEFLLSPDYVVELLTKQHAIAAPDAKRRSKRIAAHVRLALAYLAQAASGPADVGFVPIYYSLLNLIKIYILTSSKHADLSGNRWHGASYDVYGKASQSLKTEVVTIHPKGAIPLFYEVVTGRQIGTRRKVKLGDVYPYIFDIGSEWSIAAADSDRLRSASFGVRDEPSGQKRFVCSVTQHGGAAPLKAAEMPVLRDVRRSPAGPEFLGRTLHAKQTSNDVIVDSHVNRYLLYHPWKKKNIVPLCSRSFYMFEELPILLAFFHLSSVTRYNPELVAKLRDSRFWPVMSSLQFHAVTKFMLLFWSHMQQQTTVYSAYAA